MGSPSQVKRALVATLLIATLARNAIASAAPSPGAIDDSIILSSVARAASPRPQSSRVPSRTPINAVPTSTPRVAAPASPTPTPLPVTPHLLTSVQLGGSLARTYAQFGPPQVVIYQRGYSYWAFNTDSGHAWLVIAAHGTTVQSAQFIAKARQRSTLRNTIGVALGDPRKRVTALAGAGLLFTNGVLETKAANGTQTFYGLTKSNTVDRIGRTLGDTFMPEMIRWYEFTGWTADRAIPASMAAGGSSVGEARYIASMKPRPAYPSCIGGNGWHVVSRQRISYTGLPLDELRIRCGLTSYEDTIYFSVSANTPRAFNDDIVSQHLLQRAGVHDARVALSVRRLSVRPMTSPTAAPQIWFTTPNGTRFLNGTIDPHFTFTYDPNDPPGNAYLNYSTSGVVPMVVHRQGGVASAAAINGIRPMVGGGGGQINCGMQYGSGGKGSSKCSDSPAKPPCPYPSMDNGAVGAAACFPTNPNKHRDPCKGDGGAAGHPIDVATGFLWRTDQDFQLSGPFGLSFQHRYDSQFPTYQGRLGVGWRDTYGAYLDTTYVGNGFVTFYDANCNEEDFAGVGPGVTVFDQFSGGYLTENASGGSITSFTLTTWDHNSLTFSATGALSSMTDRIGNAQTISRDGQGRIGTVTDSLGRSLQFGYDSNNRVNSITSMPTAISVSFTYDSDSVGNCYSGDLCTAKESDGSTWTYEYYNPSTMGGDHLLMKVLDPLGHEAEYNQYTMVDIGDGNPHYRVTHQETDGAMNAWDLAYSLNGTIGTTTISNTTFPLQTTTYTWDENLAQVLSVTGPLCDCNGDKRSYTYDLFGRRLSTASNGTVSQTLAYGRDKIFTSPDGLTTYSGTAYPSVTDRYDVNISTLRGPAIRHVQYTYYPLNDPSNRGDLVNVTTEPSVVVGGNNVTTTDSYNSQGLLLTRARTGYLTPTGGSTTYTTTYTYDPTHGRIKTVTGPRTDVATLTTFNYYSDTDSDLAGRGQLQSVSRQVTASPAFNLVTTYAGSTVSPYNTYTLYGGPGSIVDPNGVVTDLDHDALGRVTKSTVKGVSGDPGDLATAFSYDTASRLTKVTYPLSNGIAYSYNNSNDLTATTLFNSSGLQYDRLQKTYNVISEVSSAKAQSCTTPATSCAAWATQNSESYSYSPVGNLQTTTFPTGGSITNNWTGAGNYTGNTSGDSSYSVSTVNQYDASHNLTVTGNGNGYDQATYTHDLQGNVDSVTISLASSAVTAYYHDDFGRLRQRVSPYEGTSIYQYDPDGNLTQYTDGNGAVTVGTYDALDRPLKRVSTPAIGSLQPTETVSYTWDQDASSGTFRLGRLAKMTDPSGSTTYSYERRGNVNGTTQVVSGVSGGTYTTTYAYDGNGNRDSVTLPSGRALTYTFDYADRPYSVQGSLSGSSATYVSSATYEPFGPPLSIAFGNGTMQAWTYNQRYLPAENKLTYSSTTLSDLKYTENAVGYVTQIADQLNAGYTRNYAYGGHATNMLTSAITGASLWGAATYGDTYAQNLTNGNFPGRNLTFALAQGNSQLVSVNNSTANTLTPVTFDGAGNELQIGSATYVYSARNLLASGDGISYTYDGLGRRVTATMPAYGTRVSLYDPRMHLQWESQMHSGSIAYDYIWFGDIPVAQEDVGGQTHWTVTDHLGTPFIQTNAAGAIYWQADYEPFGAVYKLRTPDAHQPLRFPGQEAEELDPSQGPNGASARFYNGYRWYRPQWGRYTQIDPVEYAGNRYNLYGYTEYDPTNRIDPQGLTPPPWAGGIWLTHALQGAGNVWQWLTEPGPPPVPPNWDTPPGDDWGWKGNGPQGSDRGAWHNPGTGETLHPDPNHGPPEGPHWDWIPPKGYVPPPGGPGGGWIPNPDKPGRYRHPPLPPMCPI